MALQAAAVAGTVAAAAYLDAKLHIRHDLSSGSLAHAAAKAQKFIAEREASGRLSLYHVLEEQATRQPDHLLLEYDDRSWTYGQFFQALQRVGNWLMADLDIQPGEMVALDGPNSAEYMMIWLALEGVGAGISFVNSHSTGPALMHSVKLCGTRLLLAESGISDLVTPHTDELAEAGVTTRFYNQDILDSLHDTTPIPEARRHDMKSQDVRHLIYTSGTTGLPKAVEIMQGRHLNTARGIAEYLKLAPNDKMFTCLPLYHGAGQSLCTSPTIFAGASMTLSRKFSHATFWPEVHASRATRLQYVGELCRYLVNAPIHPLERSHNLVEAWGNGMRPDVWEKFRQRFNIPIIHELYAATDGMGTTMNKNRGEFSRSAIAVRGSIWHYRQGANEVRARIDPDTEDIVRGDDGYVVAAQVGEPGEVLHRVDPALKVAAFRGYFKNEQASEKRWMRNVFQPNDLWFRSGDVMRVDGQGRVFFVDRLGDTFRWKSENVSTNEVSDIIGTFDQIAETNVYGVSVPNADGRCGCAVVVLQPPTTPETLDRAALAQHARSRLPRYAVPLFLRVGPISYTGTFKIQKGQAKREGVDLDQIEKSGSKDRLFWLPPGASSYMPYTRDDWEALQSGKIQL